MNRKHLLVPFTASALLLALCGAASADENAALKKCMDGANTTADMVDCNTKETKVQARH